MGIEGPVPSVMGQRCVFRQIFNLMKFDSYTRFLKSPLYQECILAEVEGRPLPDAQQVPSSPASKHSASSDHSNTSTPKKVPIPCACLPQEGALQTADIPVGVFPHLQNLKGLHCWGSGRGGGQLLVWRCWRAAPPSAPPPGRPTPLPFVRVSCDPTAASCCFNSAFPLTAAERKIEIRTVPE